MEKYQKVHAMIDDFEDEYCDINVEKLENAIFSMEKFFQEKKDSLVQIQNDYKAACQASATSDAAPGIPETFGHQAPGGLPPAEYKPEAFERRLFHNTNSRFAFAADIVPVNKFNNRDLQKALTYAELSVTGKCLDGGNWEDLIFRGRINSVGIHHSGMPKRDLLCKFTAKPLTDKKNIVGNLEGQFRIHDSEPLKFLNAEFKIIDYRRDGKLFDLRSGKDAATPREIQIQLITAKGPHFVFISVTNHAQEPQYFTWSKPKGPAPGAGAAFDVCIQKIQQRR